MTASINLNGTPTPVMAAAVIDAPPYGYRWLTDELGNFLTDERGCRIIVPEEADGGAQFLMDENGNFITDENSNRITV